MDNTSTICIHPELKALISNWQHAKAYMSHAGDGHPVHIGWMVSCDAAAAQAMNEWANTALVGAVDDCYFITPLVD